MACASADPLRWKCLEGLCEAFYELGEYVHCLRTVTLALEQCPAFPRGLDLMLQIRNEANYLPSVADEFLRWKRSNHPLEGIDLQPEELYSELTIPNSRFVGRDRKAPKPIAPRPEVPIKKYQLHKLSWIGLGHLLLQIANGSDGDGPVQIEVLEHMDTPSSATQNSPTLISLNVAAEDIEPARMDEPAEEPIDVSQIATSEALSAIPSDAMDVDPTVQPDNERGLAEGVDPNEQAAAAGSKGRKRKKSLSDEKEKRTSTRVRTKQEHDAYDSPSIRKSIDRWMPNNYPICAEDRMQDPAMPLMAPVWGPAVKGENVEFLRAFVNRSVTLNVENDKRNEADSRPRKRAKHAELKKARFLTEEISETIDAHPTELVHSFVSRYASASNIDVALNTCVAELLCHYVLWSLCVPLDGTVEQFWYKSRWSEEMRGILERVLELLGVLGHGISSLLTDSQQDSEIQVEVMLALSEFLFDLTPAEDLLKIDEADHHPRSTRPVAMFKRAWGELSYLMSSRLDDTIDTQTQCRYSWLAALYAEESGRIEDTVDLLSDCLKLLIVAGDDNEIEHPNLQKAERMDKIAIMSKLRVVSHRQFVLDASVHYAEGSYLEVLDRLVPVFFGIEEVDGTTQTSHHSLDQLSHMVCFEGVRIGWRDLFPNFTKRCEMIEILAESCQELDRPDMMLVTLVLLVLDCASNIVESENFSLTLSKLAGFLHNISDILANDNGGRLLNIISISAARGTYPIPCNLFDQFLSQIFLFIRSSWDILTREDICPFRIGRDPNDSAFQPLQDFILNSILVFYFAVDVLYEKLEQENPFIARWKLCGVHSRVLTASAEVESKRSLIEVEGKIDENIPGNDSDNESISTDNDNDVAEIGLEEAERSQSSEVKSQNVDFDGNNASSQLLGADTEVERDMPMTDVQDHENVSVGDAVDLGLPETTEDKPIPSTVKSNVFRDGQLVADDTGELDPRKVGLPQQPSRKMRREGATHLRGGRKNLDIDPLGEIMLLMHVLLGDVGICCSDHGRFLKHSLKHFKALNDEEYTFVLYQTYHCLYGIPMKIEPDTRISFHNAQSLPFDQDAASEVFTVVAAYVEKKLSARTNRGITNDMRDCLDRIADAFANPPWKNPRIAMNREVISKYLTSEIKLTQTTLSGPCILVFNLPPSQSHVIPEVYNKLYSILGQILFIQFKNRSQQKKKSQDLLLQAIELFLQHAYLNPSDGSAWFQLATAYATAANDNLSWSAAEISEHFAEIRDQQKRSFHCFVEAYKRLKHAGHFDMNTHTGSPATNKALQTFWPEFGHLCYMAATQPMFAAVLRSHIPRVDILWGKRYRQSLQDESAPERQIVTLSFHPDYQNMAEAVPEEKTAIAGDGVEARQLESKILDTDEREQIKMYFETQRRMLLSLGLWCFSHASRQDPHEWHHFFMKGKLMAKLGVAPRTLLTEYARAVLLVPEEWSTKEQEKIIDPSCKLLSALSKLLYRNEIGVDLALEMVERSFPIFIPKATQKECISAAHVVQTPPEHFPWSQSDSSIEPKKLSSSALPVFGKIMAALQIIKGTDKKRWHHKPTYRIAWIRYYVFRDANGAQSEIQQLFHVKPTGKSFANLWRPEFEPPGKHFVYIEKYTQFFIAVLKESKDVECLRGICRKVRSAVEHLLWPESGGCRQSSTVRHYAEARV
ncbi:hypothetical protein BJ742DRAFT_319702 [Cladochytrium replicatum]|nr:hypothetical protein BJ742DRAFT_319702 [Cladochytrium replicatum]